MSSRTHWLTITDLGKRYRSGKLSPVEVTQATLDRIDRLDGTLRAYVTVLHEPALEEARTAERELRSGRDRGPLHGVPIGVKDLVATRGVRTTSGTAVMRDHVPTEDSCLVERLREAGAVLLGKLALTEGAYAAHHPSVPAPLNPWDPKRWPGVSSSGSGVATAAGLCFGSLGTDTGGSIRFPSAANGVVGLKPTWGRVPRHGVFPLAASLDHVGPMTRSAVDAAALLGVIAGHDPRDPTSLHAPVPDYARAARKRNLSGVRVGVDERFVSENMDASIARTVLDCADVLRDAGATIQPIVVPPYETLLQLWPVVCGAETLVAHESFFPARADEYGPELRLFLEAAQALKAADYAKAHEERMLFNGRLAGVFGEVDLILCPSLGIPVPEAKPDLRRLDPSITLSLMRFTAPFDFSGSPTISLPCGFTDDGMPVSLQLVGRHLDEALLCRAGAAFEKATGWDKKHPRV